MSANRLPSIPFHGRQCRGAPGFFTGVPRTHTVTGKRDEILTVPGAYDDTGGIRCDEGNAGKRPIRGIIWYDFGFGTRRRETESKRLRHESGSAILRNVSIRTSTGCGWL